MMGPRSAQPAPKGVLSESKKSQDVSSGSKPWPRGGRRREPHHHGSNLPSSVRSERAEVSRKPAPQRSKASVDKRPRARGSSGFYAATTQPSASMEGSEEAELEMMHEAEIGSVLKSGSKKQNHNHLVGFFFEGGRDGLQHNGASSYRYYQHNHSKVKGYRNFVTKHKYNKEEFLQANCQFVVRECGDYTKYMKNPDTLVDWNSIQQINLPVTEFPSCPICLELPVAAKMTRCGHIYCWSCMLYYLSLSESKCPICFVEVRKSDLRSVVVIPYSTINVGKLMTFKLMKRMQGSLITYPCDYPIQEGDDDMPLTISEHNAVGSVVYCKLLLANKTDVISVYERERKEMKRLLAEDENCREKFCIEEALSTLTQREELLHDENYWSGGDKAKVATLRKSNKKERLASCSDGSCDGAEYNLERINSQSSGEESSGYSSPGTAEALLDRTKDLRLSSSDSFEHQNKCYYFYQASDGQHIYLDPLNTNMLVHSYGSLEQCPKIIQGTLLEKNVASVDGSFRARYKFLQHLPVTCQFEWAEIAIGPPLVSKETMEEFQKHVKQRKKERQKRATKEKNREKSIAEYENKRLGRQHHMPADIRLESHLQFPSFLLQEIPSPSDFAPFLGEDNFSNHNCDEATASAAFGSSIISEDSFPSGSRSAKSFAEDPSPPTGVSFAKMLSSSNTCRPSWPARKVNPLPNSEAVTVVNGSSDDYESAPSAANQSIADFITIALLKSAGDTKARGKKKKKRGGRKASIDFTDD